MKHLAATIPLVLLLACDPPQRLEGTRWKLVEADGRAIAGQPGYDRVTLSFRGREFGGQSGCNVYGARYRREGRRIITDGIDTGLMGCEPPLEAAQDHLYRILGASFEYEIEPEGSLLILKDGRRSLRFQRLP